MNRILLDTNLLLRLHDVTSPHQQMTQEALIKVRMRGDFPCITTQNLIEFWSVATRPINVNGFAWTTSKVETEVNLFLSTFSFLADTPEILTHWMALVAQHDIKGRRTHDARLAAVMLAHGVTHLLTFNTDDFKSFSSLTLVHPSEI